MRESKPKGARSGRPSAFSAEWLPVGSPAGDGLGRGAALAAVVVITLLAAALRLWGLDRESLWLDEAFSVALAREPWDEFQRVLTTREANMALYHGLLRLWIRLGESEASVRALSVAFAVLTVPAMYALGSRLLGRRAGLLAALLLALHGSHLRYSQEARGYSLAVLLVTLSSLAFACAVPRPSRRAWAAYAITSALAIYAHLFAALALAGQWASLAFLRPRDVPWRGLAWSGGAVAALVLPLAGFVLGGDVGQIGWVPPPGPQHLGIALWSLAGTGGEIAAYAALGAVALVGGWRDLRVRGRSVQTWRTALPACWLLLPPILAFAASFAKPVLVERYLLVCVPAFILLAVAGLARVEPARRRGLALVATICLAVSGIGIYHRMYLKEDWRGATRFVLSEARPGDALLIYPPYLRRAYDYYQRRLDQPAGGPEVVFPTDYTLAEPDPSLVARLSERHGRVWVLLSHIGYSGRDPEVVDRVIRGNLNASYRTSRTIPFTRVRVLLFSDGREEELRAAGVVGDRAAARRGAHAARRRAPVTASALTPEAGRSLRTARPASCWYCGQPPAGLGKERHVSQEAGGHRQPTHTVYTIVEGTGDKSRWLECGVAFTNRDGSINLLLNALPVNGRLQLRDSNGRKEKEPVS